MTAAARRPAPPAPELTAAEVWERMMRNAKVGPPLDDEERAALEEAQQSGYVVRSHAGRR